MATRFVLWLITLVVFPIPPSLFAQSFQLEVLQRITLGVLPPEEPLTADLSERVLSRLENSEKKEIDPWRRDDLRISWITTKWAAEGVPQWCYYSDDPYIAATYQVLHCHPDQVWPHIVADRKAKLGPLYDKFYPEQVWGAPVAPRKPVQSVKADAAACDGLAA